MIVSRNTPSDSARSWTVRVTLPGVTSPSLGMAIPAIHSVLRGADTERFEDGADARSYWLTYIVSPPTACRRTATSQKRELPTPPHPAPAGRCGRSRCPARSDADLPTDSSSQSGRVELLLQRPPSVRLTQPCDQLVNLRSLRGALRELPHPLQASGVGRPSGSAGRQPPGARHPPTWPGLVRATLLRGMLVSGSTLKGSYTLWGIHPE